MLYVYVYNVRCIARVCFSSTNNCLLKLLAVAGAIVPDAPTSPDWKLLSLCSVFFIYIFFFLCPLFIWRCCSKCITVFVNCVAVQQVYYAILLRIISMQLTCLFVMGARIAYVTTKTCSECANLQVELIRLLLLRSWSWWYALHHIQQWISAIIISSFVFADCCCHYCRHA